MIGHFLKLISQIVRTAVNSCSFHYLLDQNPPVLHLFSKYTGQVTGTISEDNDKCDCTILGFAAEHGEDTSQISEVYQSIVR